MEEDIKKILEIAAHAPSGENAQPWKFKIQDNKIYIFNIPERDKSLYNYKQRGSLVSHGALIENIVIASSAYGYEAEVNLLPDAENPNLIAMVSLSKSALSVDSLYPYIVKRCTNRKPYKTKPLSEEQISELAGAAEKGSEVLFVNDRKKIEALAGAGSVNERVMFSNKLLHAFFFSHINWTEEEDKAKGLGFYIKTLELPLPAQIGLKVFKYWSLMELFNKAGLSEAIGKGNAKVYATSSAMGAVVVEGDTPKDFIAAGRAMQRVWLKATKMSLSVQPLTGVLFFMHRISAGHTEEFNQRHTNLIKDAYEKIYETFAVTDKVIAMMFRIGYGGEPTARTHKLPPQITN